MAYWMNNFLMFIPKLFPLNFFKVTSLSLLDDFEEAARWSGLTHLTHWPGDLWCPGREGPPAGTGRKRTLWTTSGWKAFWLRTRLPLVWLVISGSGSVFHTWSDIYPHRGIELENIRLYDFGETLVQSWTTFFRGQEYWATLLWTWRGSRKYCSI